MSHVVHLGDCLAGMRTLADKSVDHVICDPPYSEHVHKAQRRGHMAHEPGTGRATFNRSTDLGFAHLDPDFAQDIADELARVVRRWVLVFCDLEGVDLWRRCIAGAMGDEAGTVRLEAVRVGIWVKIGCTPQFTGDRPAVGAEGIVVGHATGRKRWNGGGKHAVWTHPIALNRGGVSPRNHPTEKPIDLMLDLVRDFTDPGELILDPFAGSGTTGVACKLLGRSFIGWELDPRHHATATRRIAETCEAPELVGLEDRRRAAKVKVKNAQGAFALETKGD